MKYFLLNVARNIFREATQQAIQFQRQFEGTYCSNKYIPYKFQLIIP